MKAVHIRMLKVVIGIAILLAVLVFVILPRISAAREAARRNHCLICMRSLGKVCVLYAMDHNGAFPNRWSDLTDSYVGHPGLFNCKSTPQPPGSIETVDEWAEFVLVPGLTTNSPPDTVLAYEPLSNHGGNGGNVVFCDTSFRWLDASEYASVMKGIDRGHQKTPARDSSKAAASLTGTREE